MKRGLITVLARVPFTVIKYLWPRPVLGRKDLFQLSFPYHSPSWKEIRVGTQDRNMVAETKAEALEESNLLACLVCFLRMNCPRVALSIMYWALHINQKLHYRLLYRPIWWSYFLNREPLFPIELILYHWKKNQTNQDNSWCFRKMWIYKFIGIVILGF